MKLALALFVACALAGPAFVLLGCRTGREGQVANCGPRGVQQVKTIKDPTNELIVCQDGRVFSTN